MTEHIPCHFFHFGLLVTGETEYHHITKLLASLAKTGLCSFKVIRRIDQLNPITSETRQLRMIGSGQIIPSKDAETIGFPARTFIQAGPCHYVILVDDLEPDRTPNARAVFERYRTTLNTILKDQKHRASVHFLVNMLEAYYFADAQAINNTLNLSLPIDNFDGDVETIHNPKSELKKLYPTFNEIDDGGNILEQLNVERVLSDPDTCAGLRTLFAWCVKVLEKHAYYDSLQESPSTKYNLAGGIYSEITKGQIDEL